MMMSTSSVHMAVLHFSRISIPNAFYMACEKEIYACHGVIEIKFNRFVTDMSNHSLHTVAFLIL
jgi:hypothetical protein